MTCCWLPALSGQLFLAKGRCSLKTQQATLLFLPYLICLCAIVFTPIDPNSAGLFGFIQIAGLTERFLNLFLLVPLGILTKISYNQFSLRIIVIICTCTSAGIEVIQLIIPGRVSDLVDVFANSLGVACGLLVFRRFTQKRSTHRSWVGKMHRSGRTHLIQPCLAKGDFFGGGDKSDFSWYSFDVAFAQPK